ncbi:RpiB/LacA/LacB family sugar-phosphate isomerase [Phytomonospora endophytica]|uniref:D-erythrulose 4-phosphate isomerase n=1 Tax=Phytomonospora endophytica TaxID=714109 RepID=A0A841FLE6_9ACTN|nr:RpiB/LacA/LacB family sugar-phosphate isomerase [Phytomonospora endophytica]MBB6038151.1 ribose 5-phosphate isomerase B [Phytomonospora endophytica]GIG67386.1 D-erythrulose-4-phosphate isomerase 1 [Phytomonospora endophytica]
MTVHKWRIAVGSDSAGYEYKETIARDLADDDRVDVVIDFGVRTGESTPYPNVGLSVAEAVASGEVDRAILVCGTGIGMAISANKVPGVYAATVSDSYSCERSVRSNDCRVLTLGQRVIGLELARRLVSEWIGYAFDPDSPSGAKVDVIHAYEEGRE